MLKLVKFRNYKSFSEETTIDLNPSKIEYLSTTNIYDNTLKGCAFYGGNATGKTCAINVIGLLLDLLFKEFHFDDFSYSKFSANNKSFFEYTFDIENSIIVYSFEITKSKGITSESLSVNNMNLLTRTLSSAKTYITQNEDFDKLDANTLFIKTLYFNTGFAGNDILQKWYKFLKNSIYINPMRLIHGLVIFDEKSMDVEFGRYIEKNGVSEINNFFSKFNFPFELYYPELDKNIAKVVPIISRIFIKRKDLAPIPLQLESNGTLILLKMLPSFLSVINNGGMLIIDEFSSGLHDDLEELLLRYFYTESKNSQLFFVSHSTNLLKTSLIRPDQVYSVDLDNKGSHITKFSEFGIRESQNMEKMYLSGAFGGIPLYESTIK